MPDEKRKVRERGRLKQKREQAEAQFVDAITRGWPPRLRSALLPGVEMTEVPHAT